MEQPFLNHENSIHFLDPYPEHKKPVVFLHGLGSDATSWGFQIQALGESGYRPIAVDLPGFGQSQPLRPSWTIRKTCETLSKFIDSLSETKVDLVGISLGGAVALQFGISFEKRIEHLVLINTFACLRPEKWDQRLYLLRRFLVSTLRGVDYQANLVAERLFPEESQGEFRKLIVEQIKKSNKKNYLSAMVELAKFDMRKDLPRVISPTLVISGENDTTVAMRFQNELAEGISHSKHIIIPNAGHAAIVEKPADVNRALLGFLSD